MATLPPTLTLSSAQQAVLDVRRLFLDLGADEQFVRGVMIRTDGDERPYVRIPALPVEMAEHLVRLLPPGAVS